MRGLVEDLPATRGWRRRRLVAGGDVGGRVGLVGGDVDGGGDVGDWSEDRSVHSRRGAGGSVSGAMPEIRSAAMSGARLAAMCGLRLRTVYRATPWPAPFASARDGPLPFFRIGLATRLHRVAISVGLSPSDVGDWSAADVVKIRDLVGGDVVMVERDVSRDGLMICLPTPSKMPRRLCCADGIGRDGLAAYICRDRLSATQTGSDVGNSRAKTPRIGRRRCRRSETACHDVVTACHFSRRSRSAWPIAADAMTVKATIGERSVGDVVKI
jgi:hypothetical protein